MKDKIMKIKKIYKEILSKENKTIYEDLYIKSYNDEADDLLEQYIKIQKNNKMYNFYVYPSSDHIVICYSYKNYDVYFELYNDKYIYYIDAPEKYDFLEERKEIEKEETILIDINNLNSLNDLFLIIYEKTKSINERIDIFNKTINPSVLTNGKLLFK